MLTEEKEPAGLEEALIGPSMPEPEPLLPPDPRVLPSLRGPELLLPPARARRPRLPDTVFVPVEVREWSLEEWEGCDGSGGGFGGGSGLE